MPHMNTPQKILDLIFKIKYYEDFKSSLTKDERDFIQSIQSSSLKYVKISKLYDGNTILTACATSPIVRADSDPTL